MWPQVALEKEAEKRARLELVKDFEQKHPGVKPEMDHEKDIGGVEKAAGGEFQSYVRLPEPSDLEGVLLERKRREALDRLEASIQS